MLGLHILARFEIQDDIHISLEYIISTQQIRIHKCICSNCGDKSVDLLKSKTLNKNIYGAGHSDILGRSLLLCTMYHEPVANNHCSNGCKYFPMVCVLGGRTEDPFSGTPGNPTAIQ